MAFTMNSLSHRVIEDPHFVAFCMAVARAKGRVSVPNRKQLRDRIVTKAGQVRAVRIACLVSCVTCHVLYVICYVACQESCIMHLGFMAKDLWLFVSCDDCI